MIRISLNVAITANSNISGVYQETFKSTYYEVNTTKKGTKRARI
jgi:hypothetical protein